MKAKIQNKNIIYYAILLVLSFMFFHIQSNIFTSVLTAGDGLIHSVPSKIFSSNGSLWNPYVNSGTYVIKDSGSQSCYLPALIIMKMFPNIFGYNLCMLLHYWAAGCFMFMYLRKIKLQSFSSMLGAIAFMFSGFMIAHSVHYNMIMAAVYLPAILFFIEKYFEKNKFSYLFCGAILFSLSLSSDYPAVTMYIGMLVFPYIIVRSINNFRNQNTKKKWCKIINMILYISSMIFIVGTLLSSYYWMSIIQSFSEINRNAISFEIFNQFSLPIYCLVTLLIPGIFGMEIASQLYPIGYFGEWNGGELAFYIGILTIIFTIYAILCEGKKILTKFYFFALIASLLLAFGGHTPLAKIMYHVPIYNMFRCSARLVYLTEFCFAVLLAIGVDSLENNKINYKSNLKKLNKIFITIISFMLFAVLSFYLIKEKISSIVIEKNIGDNLAATYLPSLIHGSSIQQILDAADKVFKWNNRLLIVPLITIIVTWIIVMIYLKKDNNKLLGYLLMGGLLYFDLFFSTRYYIPPNVSMDYTTYIESAESDWLIQHGAKEGKYRFLTMDYNKYTEYIYPIRTELIGLYTVNSYGPIWLENYAKLSTFETTGLSSNPQDLLLYNNFLSLSSTKYLITDNESSISLLELGERNNQEFTKFSNMGETLDNSYKKEGNYILSKADKDPHSLIAIWGNFEKNNLYEITFDVSSDTDDLILNVDISGENPNSTEMQSTYIVLNDNQQGEKVEKSILLWTTGELQGKTCLRFFTTSAGTVELTNIKIDTKNLQNEWPYAKCYENKNGIEIWENKNALSRARFVDASIQAENIDEVADILLSTSFNPEKEAITFNNEERYSKGEVLQADYSNEQSPKFMVKTDGKAMFILADSFYPGWQVTVNEEEAEILKVNGFQRGVILPEQGEYKIIFTFKPLIFYIGILVSCLVGGGGIIICAIERRK